MQQLQRKYIKQGKEIRKNQTAAENFDIYTCLIFGRYYHQRFLFFFWKEDWAPGSNHL